MIFDNIKLYIKLILRKIFTINQFCKICGKTCRSFYVEDSIWDEIECCIRHGNILCYDCFCDIGECIGLPATWRLIAMNDIKLGDPIGDSDINDRHLPKLDFKIPMPDVKPPIF